MCGYGELAVHFGTKIEVYIMVLRVTFVAIIAMF